MDLPATLLTLRCLVRDTFRQAVASGIFWLMLGITALSVLFCLSVGVVGDAQLPYSAEEPREWVPRGEKLDPDAARKEGVDVVGGDLTLAFGLVRVQLARGRDDAVRYLELLLAMVVADVGGLLLALVWTSGFMPAFLEQHAVSVLLAKPVPRWSLLLGKYLGVLAFVLVQAVLFVGGTWLALALRTGVWDPTYLLCIVLLLLHFAIFFSFSTLLAVSTRSTVVCVFGSLVFWFLCWGMNYGRHALVALEPGPVAGSAAPEPELVSPLARAAGEAGYWVLPKPADLGILLYHALRAEAYAQELHAFKAVEERGRFNGTLSVFASLLFTGCLLAVAARQFVTMDY
jgi:ABC-type transport system involved in multi-copper enzyme maturation permease subunit